MNLLLAAVILLQDKTAEQLIEQLRSDQIEQRASAYEGLKKLGEGARTALEKASRSPDAQVALTLRSLLRRIDVVKGAPAALLELIPSALNRLADGDDSEWVRLFIELARMDPNAPGLRQCLDSLVARTFKAATSSKDKKDLCDALNPSFSRSVLQEVVRLLKDEDGEVRVSAAKALGELKAYEREGDIARLLQDPNPAVRSGAMGSLAKIFNIDALPLLMPLLRDPDHDVRSTLVYLLYGPGSGLMSPLGAYAKELIPLLGDPDEEIRQIVCTILGWERCHEASPGLMVALTDAEPSVRQEAAAALGKVGAREAIPALLRSLSAEEKDVAVRAASALALGALKAQEAVPLGRSLLEDADPSLRRAAGALLWDLEDWTSATGMAKLLKDGDEQTRDAAELKFTMKPNIAIGEAVLSLLEDPDADTRQRALRVLGANPLDKARPAVVRRLSDADPEVRTQAMWRVWGLHIREAVPELKKLLLHENEDTRERAVETLAHVGGKRTADDLVPLLQDPSPRVRGATVRALGMLERAEDLPRFVRCLSDADVRTDAERAITRQGGREAYLALKKSLPGSDEALMIRANQILSRIYIPEMAADLMGLLHSGSASAQKQAVETLTRLGARDAVSALVPLLESPDPGVRESVLDALGSLGAKETVPKLRLFLGDTIPTLRRAALLALTDLEDRESAPLFMKLLGDQDDGVRSAACWSLGFLGDREASSSIERLLEDDYWDVRRYAIQALAVLGAKGSARKILRPLGEPEEVLGWAFDAESLGMLEAQDLIPEYRKRLKHRYAPTRAEAAIALGELGCVDAVPELLKLLEDPNESVLGGAADALGRLQAREAIPALRAILRRPERNAVDWGPPTEVVEALVRLRAREAIPELLRQLEKSYPHTLMPALQALRHFPDRETLPRLLALFTSGNGLFWPYDDPPILLEERGRIPAVVSCNDGTSSSITYSVPEILADLDAREYIPDIEKLLVVGSKETRMDAAQALCCLGSTKGVPFILSEAKDGNAGGLVSLNALRRPVLWKQMQNTYFPKSLSLSKAELWRDIARASGLRLEMTGRAWHAGSDSWIPRTNVRYYENLSTLLEVAKAQLAWTPFIMILEEDRIRVLRAQEALPLWESWWKEVPEREKK